MLEDLGSTNGTYVGGERLKPGIKRPLTAGEQIKLAEIQLIFDGEVPGDERTQTFVHRQISDIFSPAAVTESVPFLTAVAGINEGATTFRIEERDHVYMFGRTRRCEFRVKTAEVSREHASFIRRTDGIYVNDLGSVNGVLVNNTKVQEFKLFDGDLIQIGHVKLRLFDPSDPSPRGADASTATALGADRGEVRATPPHPHGVRDDDLPPHARDEKSATFPSELHPLIAGAMDREDVRHRRPSVRIRIAETWESSSRFRYGIVIVAASLLGICAVIVGFSLAG